MAVPATMTTLNMSGKYVQNKELSDDHEEVLRLQDVSFITRKAIGMATLTTVITQTKEDDVEKLVTQQILTIGQTTEERPLDWVERAMDNKVFGKSMVKSRRVKVDEIEEEYLKGPWAAACQEHGVFQTHAEGVDISWVANAIWGLEEVNGEVRYVRRLVFTGPQGEKFLGRLVFDYVSAE